MLEILCLAGNPHPALETPPSSSAVCTRTMGRGGHRSRPTGPLRLAVLFLAAVVGAVSAAESMVFRCESEDDLDGASCRVDMLPDAALAEMVYER